MTFTYQPYPVRVLFGQPLLKALKGEKETDTAQNIWVIASSRYNELVSSISESGEFVIAGRTANIIQHVPEKEVKKAVSKIKKARPVLLLSIGGGSATGLAKAIALKYPASIWAVPATYSGSEMTNIYGISFPGKKHVGRDNRVLPKKVFYDPALSENLPIMFAAKSAMNAMAHLVEAVYSRNNNPFTYHSALQGIGPLFEGMNHLAGEGSLNREINEKFLLGGCLAGKTLCEVSMALHHKAAHVLGGSFGLDHAGVHTVLLPYVLQYQWPHLESSLRDDFRQAFSDDHPPSALKKTSQKLGVPTTLRQIGFLKKNAAAAADELMALSFDNPAPLHKNSLTTLIERAYHGDLEK
jgi:maleylacetate reductase